MQEKSIKLVRGWTLNITSQLNFLGLLVYNGLLIKKLNLAKCPICIFSPYKESCFYLSKLLLWDIARSQFTVYDPKYSYAGIALEGGGTGSTCLLIAFWIETAPLNPWLILAGFYGFFIAIPTNNAFLSKVCFGLKMSCMCIVYRLHFQNAIILVIVNIFCSKCTIYHLPL